MYTVYRIIYSHIAKRNRSKLINKLSESSLDQCASGTESRIVKSTPISVEIKICIAALIGYLKN